jgi:hypothetical protein
LRTARIEYMKARGLTHPLPGFTLVLLNTTS